MNTGFKNHFDKAMAEVESQRQLFWQSQQRRLKRLSLEWQEAIERGEELLRHAQRRKIESDALFPLL